MEKLDRQHLENCFGTDPEVEDLKAGIELLQEWIAEIKDKEDEHCKMLITSTSKEGVFLDGQFFSNFIELLDGYIFLDDSPCGKEIEEDN